MNQPVNLNQEQFKQILLNVYSKADDDQVKLEDVMNEIRRDLLIAISTEMGVGG
ncbi:hypothetical protein [Bacillus suaedae]|uniref:Uncharacterized protein n=1 Tax=Halalkalibacter suaedae TaxID=2822140 RepID=A0A941AP77_9BACI|nr:hypothetical protein [Bacillus suaedae]MBP3951521.1 hypothetical protein [Bacillus suaedae]